MSVLTALSAYQMYRRHVGMHVLPDQVVTYMLNNQDFPRTVVHCLSEIEGCLAALPHHAAPMQAARRAWRRVTSMKVAGLTPVVLHEYLEQIQADLAAIHDELSDQYFYLHQRQQQDMAAVANQ